MKNNKKIAFALGGGGAKGYSHIGAIKALEKAGIKPDIITGTSIGAIVGAVYAAGNLDKLEKISREIRITDLPRLLSPSWSLSGFFSGENATDLLLELAECENIEDLKIPYGAVSADLNTGEVNFATSGDLSLALKASFAIPGIFAPVKVKDKLLVDGGLVDPVPVHLAKQMGADSVIAIELFGNTKNVEIPILKKEESGQMLTEAVGSTISYLKSLKDKVPIKHLHQGPNALEILEKTLDVSQQLLTSLKLKETPPNFILSPPVSKIGLLDFHRANGVIELGEIEVNKYIEEIKLALE